MVGVRVKVIVRAESMPLPSIALHASCVSTMSMVRNPHLHPKTLKLFKPQTPNTQPITKVEKANSRSSARGVDDLAGELKGRP